MVIQTVRCAICIIYQLMYVDA